MSDNYYINIKNKMNDTVFDKTKYYPYSIYNRAYTPKMRLNTNSNNNKTRLIQIALLSPLVILAILLLMKLMIRGIDIHIQNEDMMLCKSAKISGNTEYLNKCECFYETKDITCMEGGE